MQGSRRWGKLLRLGALVFSIIGLTCWLWTAAIWFRYSDILPRSPNPTTGSVYPLNIHGIVVYETLSERSRLENWTHLSWGMLVLAVALGIVDQSKKDRSGGRARA